jgi:hypothetical protein
MSFSVADENRERVPDFGQVDFLEMTQKELFVEFLCAHPFAGVEAEQPARLA